MARRMDLACRLFGLRLHYTDEMFELPNRQDFRVTAVLAAAVPLATCIKTNKVVGFSRNGITNTEISSAAAKTLGWIEVLKYWNYILANKHVNTTLHVNDLFCTQWLHLQTQKAAHLMVPARKLGTKKNQIILMKQFGIITLGSNLLCSLSDWILFKSLLCTKEVWVQSFS